MRVKMDETSSLSMRHCTSAASIEPLSGFSTARVTDCADMLATMSLLTHACSPAHQGHKIKDITATESLGLSLANAHTMSVLLGIVIVYTQACVATPALLGASCTLLTCTLKRFG